MEAAIFPSSIRADTVHRVNLFPVSPEKEEALLRRIGVFHVQGFRFGRPMPLEALQTMFAELQARSGKREDLTA